MKKDTYEVEIKVEIDEEQDLAVQQKMIRQGFADNGVTHQYDYYTKAVESQIGPPPAYDIERYRSENGKFFFTMKEWELINGKPARKEADRPITQEEFEKGIASFKTGKNHNQNSLKIMKHRHWFGVSLEGKPVSLTIDETRFDHSLGLRYFLEPEIVVENKDEIGPARELILRFISVLLEIPVKEIKEAPSMFALAFHKL